MLERIVDSDLDRARRAVSRAARGETQVLEVLVPWRPLLRELLDENALARALLLVERDGRRGRIVVLPRRSTGETTITELLEEDHRRIGEIGARMCRLVHVDPARAVVLAHVLAIGMRRHVGAEEEILFPLSGQRATGVPTDVLERDHRAMLHYAEHVLSAAERLLEAQRARDTASQENAGAELLRSHGGLTAVVAEHEDREERTMFPLLDRTLSREHRHEVLRRLVLF